MSVLPLKTLDNINEQLEKVIDLLDSYQEELQSFVDDGDEKAQQKINEKMDEISAKISKRLKPIRDKAEESLKPPVEKAKKITEPIKKIMDMLPISISLDLSCLTAIVDVLMDIFDIIKKPYDPLIELIAQVPPKVIQLNNNIQKIANYQIQVDTSKTELTVPPLNIQIDPIEV